MLRLTPSVRPSSEKIRLHRLRGLELAGTIYVNRRMRAD